MEVLEVDALVYDKSVKSLSLFNTAKFSVLNQYKADKVFYLLFKDSKVRLGIILGIKDNMAFSPFSAPYGGFSFVDAECKASIIDHSTQALLAWCDNKRFNKITISLPALHYNESFYTRIINSFYTHKLAVENLDVNHHFDIPQDFEMNYPLLLQRNARKNLNNALKQDLVFEQLYKEEASRAYEIIAINRAAKNKPLRMSLEQLLEVNTITQIDLFMVSSNEVDVASAIVFHVSDTVVQVVYWGDNPEYADLRSMNFLTYQVFKHYASKEIKKLEIGISTENSIPNYGLCEFKESIGCQVSLKYSFSKEFHVHS